MIRVLVHCLEYNHSAPMQRSIGPLSLLEKTGDIECRYVSRFNWVDLLYADIVYILNPVTAVQLKFIEEVKRFGLKVIADYDDDFFNVASHNPAYASLRKSQHLLPAITKQIDEVWAVTGQLATNYLEMGKNVTVIPNAIDQRFLKKQEPGREKKILWRGGSTHHLDLYDVQEDFAYIANKYPDWELVFLANQPANDGVQFKHTYIPPQDLVEYHKVLERVNPGITVIPLRDTKFNRSKAFQGWLEGTWVGSQVICPDWQAWQVPGAINYRQGHFRETLEDLILNPKPEMYERSVKEIEEKYLVERVNELRLERLKELTCQQ